MGMRWPFKGGTERMRSAGRSRAGWAAGGLATRPAAAVASASPSRDTAIGRWAAPSRAVALPGDPRIRARPGFVSRFQPPPRAEPEDLRSHPTRPASLRLAAGALAQHPLPAHAAAGGQRRSCGWSLPLSDLSRVPERRPSSSPRWLSLGLRAPLWLGWDRSEPGAPAKPSQAGYRRARAPLALASPPRPSSPALSAAAPRG